MPIPVFIYKRLLVIFLLVTAIIAGWISMGRMKKDGWKSAIYMDGRGYYTYLPALFIYNDPSCSFYQTATVNYGDTANFINNINGKAVNKYYCGVAVLQLPFFSAAHLYAKAAGRIPNGYTKPYQYSIAFAGLFYFLAGLYFLWKLLEKFNFRKRVILPVCICFAFGTNLFYYAVYEASMSHIYSFAAITAFLFFTRSFMLAPSGKRLLLSALLFGLITILRPVNTMIILALPAMAGNRENLKAAFHWILQHKLKLLQAIFLYSAVCFIQLALYHWQTGRLVVYSYKNEGFKFLSPHLFGTLFSYDRGMFLYIPLTLLSLAGMIVIFKRSRFLFWSLLGVFVVVIYIISSWSDWRYGYSFGLRAYVEYYALFALSFAFLLDFSFANKRRLTAGLVTGLIAISLVIVYSIQQYQVVHHILHEGFMNKERYWQVFLRTGKKYEGLLDQKAFVLESDGHSNDMDSGLDWPGMETIISGPAHSGTHSSRIDSALVYSVGFCRNMNGEEFNDSLEVEISAWVMWENEEAKSRLIISQATDKSLVYSKSFPLPPFAGNGKWQKVQEKIRIPGRVTKDEYLRIFFIRHAGTIYIDDLEVKLND